jgi:ribosomal protein L20
MAAMRTAGVQLDRKVLADMAVRDPKVFRHYLDLVSKKKTGTASSS